MFLVKIIGIRGNGGHCPYQRPAVNCDQGFLFSSGDEAECFDDTECSASLKCCMQGCVHKCVAPVNYPGCKYGHLEASYIKFKDRSGADWLSKDALNVELQSEPFALFCNFANCFL